MRLDYIKLQHFRNHLSSVFEFSGGTNIFLGDNGHGKTNVLEAISYLCLTKSFYAANDAVALTIGSDFFEVEGNFSLDFGSNCAVRVAYSQLQDEKKYTINKHRIEPFTSIIGRFPVVICSPEHTPITTAGPVERRKFVDFVISQSSSLYFQQLLDFRKVIRHRNKILHDAKISRSKSDHLLEPWNEQFLTLGSSITYKRHLFVDEFRDYILSSYSHFFGVDEEPSFTYRPAIQLIPGCSEEDISIKLHEHMQSKFQEELRYGTSLVGPHRDEFILTINNLDLRKFASQGQHKTFLVALKIGEFFYLKDRCRETPILLLDDVLGELDEHRSEHLLHFVRELGQTFITSTNPRFFEGALSFGDRDKKYYIHNGAIAEHHEAALL